MFQTSDGQNDQGREGFELETKQEREIDEDSREMAG